MSPDALDVVLCRAVHSTEWYLESSAVAGQVSTTMTRANGRIEPCVDCQVTAAAVSAWVLTEASIRVIAEAMDRTAAAAPPTACDGEFSLLVAEGIALALSRQATAP